LIFFFSNILCLDCSTISIHIIVLIISIINVVDIISVVVFDDAVMIIAILIIGSNSYQILSVLFKILIMLMDWIIIINNNITADIEQSLDKLLIVYEG